MLHALNPSRVGEIAICLSLIALPVAQETSIAQSYAPPADGWAYSFEADAAAGDDAEALDGSWGHDNGSDAWDGLPIGEGAPGGVSALTEGTTTFLRIQDTGDPRADFPDPGNRKLYFTRDLSEVLDAPMDDGCTIHFRVRLATGEGLDDEFGGGEWPAGGMGYALWNNDGKGLFSVVQNVDAPQALAFGINDGAIIGTDGVSVEVDDPTQWAEAWITVTPDDSGGGTHKARVYLNGSLEAAEFDVSVKAESDAEVSNLGLGLGATGSAGAVDIDFYRIAEGAIAPAAGASITAPSNAWTLGDGAGASAAAIVGTVSGSLDNGAEFDALDGPFPGTGSVVFDGGEAEVNMGEDLVFNGATKFSMSFWIKADSTGADRGFFEPLDNGDSDTWNLRYDSTGATAGAAETIKIGIQTEDGGFDGEYADDIQTDEWQHIAFTYDAEEGEYILYVNGGVSEPTDDVGATGPIASMEYFRLGDGAKAHWAGKMSQVAVWGDHVLTEEEIGVLNTTSLQSIFSGFDPDLDDDGLPDVWEEEFGLSNEDAGDAALDGDEDGLTALEEFNLGTDPTKADTDGDTLSDKVETGSGTFVSADDTGTDPTKADTDDDDLADNVETNTGIFIGENDTGTNPHSNDSDGDGIRDATEIGLGSNPNDKDSVPDETGGGDVAYGEPEGGWDEAYEGNILPIELEWNHDNGSDEWDESGITDDDGEPGGVQIFTDGDTDFMRLQDPTTEGGTGNNRKIALTKSVLEEGVDPLEEDEAGVTLHFRLRLSTGADLSDAENWLEGGDGSPVRFGGKGMVGYGGIAGNFGFALGTPDGDEAFDEPALMLNGIVGIDDRDNFHPVADPTQWQEFWVTIEPDDEAEEGTHKVSLWHNGSDEPVEFEVGLTGTGDVSGDPEPSLFMAHPATDQIGAFDLDFLHLKAGAIAPVGATGAVPFQITDVQCDFVARTCTLVWPASSGATYTVEVSRGPEPFDWLELADGVEGDGETTTFTEENIPVEAEVRYYRVKKE